MFCDCDLGTFVVLCFVVELYDSVIQSGKPSRVPSSSPPVFGRPLAASGKELRLVLCSQCVTPEVKLSDKLSGHLLLEILEVLR